MDKRLQVAANYVRRNSPTADIGTDHGYLAAYLIKNNITQRVTASDINEKPLKAARRTAESGGISDKISFVLSDGLKDIPSEDAMDIVICGMGGELISRIILECDYCKSPDKRFILQPMTNVRFLRTTLYNNGFEILSETPVLVGGHHYTVMQACYCGTKSEISTVFGLVGKIAESADTEKRDEYILHIARKERRIASELLKSHESCSSAREHLKNADALEALIK